LTCIKAILALRVFYFGFIFARTYQMVDPSRSLKESKQVVAILDDDIAVRNSLKFLLETEGFHVRSYGSPAELLNDPSGAPFHCLVVDFHMPEMNGLDVVAKLRRQNGPTRAILVTAHPDAAIRERAAALGVPIVLKPFRDNELVDCIREI
jgi:FixJ family two-component response regulator